RGKYGALVLCSVNVFEFSCFFFQAEDGIRDLIVTGVQTCALPILRSYQFAVSTPFGVHPSVHPRSPPPGEYACVPSFPSRQESRSEERRVGKECRYQWTHQH